MGGTESPFDALRGLDRRGRTGVGVAGVIAGLLAALLILALDPGPPQPLVDAFQRLVPPPPISSRVHVVVLDAESLREVGGWPWSRFYLARLVEEIADRGASAIGLDMLLEEPDRYEPRQFVGIYHELPAGAAAEIDKLPSMDGVLAGVVARRPVVLARAGVRRGSFDFLEPTMDMPRVDARFAGLAPPGLQEFPAVVTNVPALDQAARAHGLVNGDHDSDGIVRRVPLVARAKGVLTPGFALELVRVAEKTGQVRLDGGAGRLTALEVGRRRISSTADGQLLLRFADWRRTPTTSAVNLLRKGLPDDLFKGQIVLVGLTTAGFADVVATPRSEAVSGVFVQAQAVEAILSGAGLQRPVWAPALEWGLGLLLALAAWFATPRLSTRAVAGLGGLSLAAAFGGSAWAFDRNLLVDPLPMVGPAAAITMVMVATLFLEGRRQHERLQLALEEHRGEAERRQGLLINELNHRVKNTLATVQSMAAQSMRPDRTPAEGREAFVSRLIALSTAQNLLTTEGWQSAEIADVVNLALAPFDEEAGARFTVEGPSVRLGAQHALALAMALHELAVNAAKFGALSAEAGRVDVNWRRDEEGQMVFAWREAGGPRVQAPNRSGFGTRLIQDGLARELRGRTRIEHPPEGLRFAIVFPYPEG